MKKNVIVKLLSFASVLLIFSCVSTKKFDALQAEKDAIDQSLSEANEKIANLETEKEELSKMTSDLKGQVSEIESTVSETTNKLSETESMLEEKESALMEVNKGIESTFSGVNGLKTDSTTITVVGNQLVLDYRDTVNFRTASATIPRGDQKSLEKIAELLKSNSDLTFMVEGHTDSRSISNDQYSDNWELSVARAINVVRKLIDLGVDPAQLIAAGRGEFAPAVADDKSDADARSSNRRTEIIVLPDLGTLYEMQTKS